MPGRKARTARRIKGPSLKGTNKAANAARAQSAANRARNTQATTGPARRASSRPAGTPTGQQSGTLGTPRAPDREGQGTGRPKGSPTSADTKHVYYDAAGRPKVGGRPVNVPRPRTPTGQSKGTLGSPRRIYGRAKAGMARRKK